MKFTWWFPRCNVGFWYYSSSIDDDYICIIQLASQARNDSLWNLLNFTLPRCGRLKSTRRGRKENDNNPSNRKGCETRCRWLIISRLLRHSPEHSRSIKRSIESWQLNASPKLKSPSFTSLPCLVISHGARREKQKKEKEKENEKKQYRSAIGARRKARFRLFPCLLIARYPENCWRTLHNKTLRMPDSAGHDDPNYKKRVTIGSIISHREREISFVFIYTCSLIDSSPSSPAYSSVGGSRIKPGVSLK